MSASILGKRSRRVIDAEEITVELPQSKRRTRSSAPAIYEDEDVHSTAQPAPAAKSRLGSRQAALESTKLKRVQKSESRRVNQDESSQRSAGEVQETDDLMDIENIPPSLFNTPTTVRHIDFLGLSDIPKQRVRLAGFLSTPKSSSRKQSTPRAQTAFSAARQLFTQSSDSQELVGREIERRQIHQFISRSVQSRVGGCTYVSGPPGTGKSALVQDVFRSFEGDETVEISVVNCVTLKTANDVYSKLLRDFSPDMTVGKSSLQEHLSKLFLTKSKDRSRLILLDEIDNLLDTDCEVLYTIFEWALHKSSSIILVGIANALDLTDRFLPRLKSKGLKPILLPFLPYTATQVSTIISTKLRSLLPQNVTVSKDFVPFMQPAAIQLCGKKIASQSGDLRKAFSLVQRIIDQVEKETINKVSSSTPTKKALGEVSNSASLPPTPSSSSSRSADDLCMGFTVETAPRASIAHAAKMAASIFNNGTTARLSGLNLQQKAVLCSLVAGEKRKMERNPYITPSKSTNRVPSVKELFLKYSTLCRRDDGLLQPLKDTEFRDVVASLETLGLVHEHKGRTSSLLTPTSTPSRAGRVSDDKQIVSAVSEKEMRESLSGAGGDLLKRLLEEE